MKQNRAATVPEQKIKEAACDFNPGWHQYIEHNPATDVRSEILTRRGLDHSVTPAREFVVDKIETKYLPGSTRVIAQVIEYCLEPDGSIGIQITIGYCRRAHHNNPLKGIEICKPPYGGLDERELKESFTYFNPLSKGHLVAHESRYYDTADKTIIRTMPLKILHARGYQNYLNYLSTLQPAV